MILLIDNYDSFSFNLVQAIGELVDGREGLKVVRNDALTVEQVMALAPTHIVLSPGPGKPSDAGICEALIKKASGKIPLLGVCLGHQAICGCFKDFRRSLRSQDITRLQPTLIRFLTNWK